MMEATPTKRHFALRRPLLPRREVSPILVSLLDVIQSTGFVFIDLSYDEYRNSPVNLFIVIHATPHGLTATFLTF
jgi:hypothetical protein